MNVGIIGCGRISRVHMIAYKLLKNVEVIGVSDIIIEKAKKLANQWGIENVFQDYRDILEMKNLDLIDICTPTSTHASVAIDAAKSGHNILLEKPMAVSSSECENIIKESKKHGVSLCINQHALFFSSVRKAKSLVDSGYLNLQSFEVSFYSSMGKLPSWAFKPENGGLIWEVGAHPAYLQLFFLPDIRNVYALGKKSNSVYDNFFALLKSSNDSVGLINCCFTSNQREFSCQITSKNGNRAKIDISLDTFIDKSKHTDRSYVKFYHEERDLLKSWMKAISRALYHRKKDYDFINSKFLLMKSYIESIENNSPPPVTPEQGKDTIKLLECIQKSLNTNEVVSFK